MPELTMYDALSADRVPLNPAAMPPNVAVASYCDARYAAGWIGCVHKYQPLAIQQRVLSIAVLLTSIARIIDVEPGNPAKAAQVSAWIIAMIHHGVYRPGAYADRSRMPQIAADLRASGLPRSAYVLWLADPDAHGLVEGMDAVQHGFMHAFDVSTTTEAFFPPLPAPPKPKPKPRPAKAQGKFKFAGELDFDTGVWQGHRLPSDVHYGTNNDEWSAEIQINNRDGRVRLQHLPFNAPPLGGPAKMEEIVDAPQAPAPETSPTGEEPTP